MEYYDVVYEYFTVKFLFNKYQYCVSKIIKRLAQTVLPCDLSDDTSHYVEARSLFGSIVPTSLNEFG